MNKAQRFAHLIYSHAFSECVYQMLIDLFVLLLISSSSFALAPNPASPKLTVIKILDGERIDDRGANADQFKISIKNGSTTLSSFTTDGKKDQISEGTGTSGAVILARNPPYTITEQVTNNKGPFSNNIIGYNATYSCTNITMGATVIATGSMAYNKTDGTGTRSFTLPYVTSNDNITCTITNSNSTPNNYTFSGTVFNDNGGLTLTANELGTVNSAYFNGRFELGLESGINDTSVQIRLTNCSGSNITTTSSNPQTVSSTGQYSFNVPKSSISVGDIVCLVEVEPNSWSDYSVDTTANRREVTITEGNYGYNNLDFGEVAANNTALVLKKYQYVHECNDTLNYGTVNNDTALPTDGFSTQPASAVAPGKCIAYKVEAYNRGHIDLVDVQISDTLQNAAVESVFHLPKPVGNPTNIFQSTNTTATIGENSIIISNKFNLAKTPSSSTTLTKATLYFNTKYGTTANQ